MEDFERFENTSQIDEPKYIPQAGSDDIHPWPRFLARSIDNFLFLFLCTILLWYIYPKALNPDMGVSFVLMFVWIAIEALLLSTWGTTPGKWLLRIKVRERSGEKLSYARALQRSYGVWWRGQGCGVITFITNIVAYINLENKGRSSWDEDGDFITTHGKIGTARSVAVFLLIIAVIILGIYANS